MGSFECRHGASVVPYHKMDMTDPIKTVVDYREFLNKGGESKWYVRVLQTYRYKL